MLDSSFSNAIIRSLIRNFLEDIVLTQHRPFELYIFKGRNLLLLNIDVNYSPAILRFNRFFTILNGLKNLKTN